MEIGNKIDQIIETYADNFFENTMMMSMIMIIFENNWLLQFRK